MESDGEMGRVFTKWFFLPGDRVITPFPLSAANEGQFRNAYPFFVVVVVNMTVELS